jgi:hypothetical protein
MEEKLDKIFEKISNLSVDVAQMAVSVEKNTQDLAYHIRRTDLLDEKLEKAEETWHTQLEEALVPVRWGKTTFKLLAAAGAIVAIWEAAKNLIN